MAVPFMRAYTELLVRTCHRRGAHAIGGMAAFIPSRQGSRGERGRAREGARGQGARVARTASTAPGSRIPDLVPVATEMLRRRARRAAEPARPAARRRRARTRRRCSSIPDTPGEITEQGLRTNVSVGIRYLDAWLHGVGAAAIDNLMEDAATAEISRVAGLAVGARRPVHGRAGARGGGRGRGGRRGAGALPGARARAGTGRVPDRSCVHSSASEPRQHQGRRHRARDRGGDRLRRARAGDGPPSGAVVRAVQRLAHAGARGAAAPGRARPRLVRAEPRRARAHDLARRAARGVHGARRARGRSRPRSPRRR